MNTVLADALFKIGSFEVTLTVLILAIAVIVLLVAIFAYRFNHRKQTKVAQFMDMECKVYNKKGLEKYIQKKGKKFTNPTIVVAEIRNLSYLYISYSKRNKLMYDITDSLLAGLGKIEVVARIEFDKFLFILENRSRDDVREFCKKLDERLDTINVDNFGQYDFYLYFGIYEKAPLEDPEVMYTSAAITQYSRVIENNLYYYCLEVKEALDKIKRILDEKDEDFEANKFVPYVQPKVDLVQQKVVGGEILCRWTTDGGSNFKFSPSEFIPVFEKTGFVKKIDEFMLRSGCELAQRMVSRGVPDILISVNLSSIDFMSTNFDSKVMDIVRQYAISPKNIELEIGERIILDNYKYISECVMTLRQLGFVISIDDFGKEAASIESLPANTFDVVKLDQGFLKNRLSIDKDRMVMENVLAMLSDLNYTKVVVGVEDRMTLDLLASIDRNLIIQGYAVSQPIPLPQFEVFALQPFHYDLPEIEEEPIPIIEEPRIVEEPKEIPVPTPAPAPAPVIVEVPAEPKKEYIETIPTPAGNLSINISGLGGQAPSVIENNGEISELKRQMDEMRHRYELDAEEQKRKQTEDELRRMREEIERLKNQPKNEPKDTAQLDSLRLEIERLRLQQQFSNNNNNNNQRDYRDDEISRLRREIDDLRLDRNRDRYYDRDSRIYVTTDRYVTTDNRYVATDNRDREYDLLQRQIDQLRDGKKDKNAEEPVKETVVQQNINIDELIERLSKTQNEQARIQAEKTAAQFADIKDMLEKERKEREELEAMLNELQNQKEEVPVEIVSEAEIVHEQEEADSILNLDLSTLSVTDRDEDEDEDEDEDDEVLEKPSLSLEELEAIIQAYRDKYMDDWNQHAKEELQDGYYEIINGLKYYKGRVKRTFIDRIRSATPEVKQLFNIVKNEIMKYKGVTNRLTNSYDCFYLGRKQIAKLSLTSKKVKVYLAADPSKYPDRQFPHKDMSEKKSHARTPYYTMVKSQLSVKRMNKVIADIMKENKISVDPDHKPVDYATKYKFYKSNQK